MACGVHNASGTIPNYTTHTISASEVDANLRAFFIRYMKKLTAEYQDCQNAKAPLPTLLTPVAYYQHLKSEQDVEKIQEYKDKGYFYTGYLDPAFFAPIEDPMYPLTRSPFELVIHSNVSQSRALIA